MEKWADYCISAVQYTKDHTRIIKVEVRRDNGETIGNPSEETRQGVIDAIRKGVTFVTIFKNDGKWKKGAEVGVVKIDGESFIRTDKNQRKVDNLDELPEF
ncbi:MAG: DUF3892 domain-containing protein [Polyangia bacterium]|jgi:molybdopterin biosynthesis enzyme